MSRTETDPRVRFDAFVKLVQGLALAHRAGFMGRSEVRGTLREWAGVPLRAELDNPGEFTFDLLAQEYPGLDHTTFTDDEEAPS